ncbi:MAG: radical SAM protein, partial [Lachnospiraceae bacterium]|nr:radical SAM protein [Lachnospiraceae bacterium]
MNNESLKGARVAFLTLGCKVNSYESDAMAEKLKDCGCEIVDFDKSADAYVINTCSVTNMADKKSRQMIHRAAKLNPEAVIVATGCYVQTANKEELEKNGIHVLIGNNKKNEIADLLSAYLKDHVRIKDIGDIAKDNRYETLELVGNIGHTRAYIKIQDGCNQFCTYCIIPYARGRIRSREPEEVLREIRRLAGLGYKEFVLTGIHISSYGIPLTGGQEPLIELIEKI